MHNESDSLEMREHAEWVRSPPAVLPEPTKTHLLWDVDGPSWTRVFSDGGANPNPGPTGCGYTVATGRFSTRKRTDPPCQRKALLVATEHVSGAA